MPALTEIEGATVVAGTGRPVGEVLSVLFHPSEPRAVALMVRRTRLLGVIGRRPAFVTWSDASLAEGTVELSERRLPSRRSVEAALGADVDETIIWRGMPVDSASGRRIGTVVDAALGSDGSVRAISVSTGVVGDVAHGRVQVPGALVAGFDGRAVVVEAEQKDLSGTGGLARAAAEGAVSVKAAAGEGAKAVAGSLVGASYATGRALAKAARTRPARRARRVLKGVADAFREGREGK